MTADEFFANSNRDYRMSLSDTEFFDAISEFGNYGLVLNPTCRESLAKITLESEAHA